MTWLRRRKTKSECAPDARKAREEAQRHLSEAEAQWPAVREVSASLRRMNQTNHFGEAIERIIKGTP